MECGRRDSNPYGRLGAGKLAKVWCPAAPKAAVYANSTTPATKSKRMKKPGLAGLKKSRSLIAPEFSALDRATVKHQDKRLRGERRNLQTQHFVVVPNHARSLFLKGSANLPTEDSLIGVPNDLTSVLPPGGRFFGGIQLLSNLRRSPARRFSQKPKFRPAEFQTFLRSCDANSRDQSRHIRDVSAQDSPALVTDNLLYCATRKDNMHSTHQFFSCLEPLNRLNASVPSTLRTRLHD